MPVGERARSQLTNIAATKPTSGPTAPNSFADDSRGLEMVSQCIGMI